MSEQTGAFCTETVVLSTVTPHHYPQADFLDVALAARRRGFNSIIPADDKTPKLKRWNRPGVSQLTETELRLMAKEYAGYEVGLVLKGHAETVSVLDIDREGVIARMERDTGRKLSEFETYIVLSRPETAPYKMHIYFRQTELFARLFPAQKNLNGYDLKGMGGGHVVAEGCVRTDTGEVRTGNGRPIVDIPDWLTNWLDKDQWSEGRKPALAPRTAKKKSRVVADLVPKGKRTQFLQQRAEWFVRFNMNRQRLYNELVDQFRRLCEDGETDLTPERKREIHDIAFDAKYREGDPVHFLRGEKTVKVVDDSTGEQRIVLRQVGQTVTRQRVIATLPDTVTAKEAYAQLGLNSGTGKDRTAFSRAMQDGGFVRDGGRRGETVWLRRTKSGEVEPIVTSPNNCNDRTQTVAASSTSGTWSTPV